MGGTVHQFPCPRQRVHELGLGIELECEHQSGVLNDATDLAHAIPLALLAGAGHILLGNVDFLMLGQLLIGSIPGVWIGAYFGGKLPNAVLRPAIAIVLTLVGIKLLF